MYGYHKQADKVADDIAQAYIEAANQINKEIRNIFRTFQLNAGLSEEEARKLLHNLPDTIQLSELKKIVGKIKDPVKKQELLNAINAPAYAWRIRRFQKLQQDIDEQTKQLAEFEQNATHAHYVDLTQEAYNRTMFDVQKGTGFGCSFAQMPVARIMEILDNNWSGKLFSTRIWGKESNLNQKIKQELLVGFMTGRSYRKTAAAIEEKMAVGAMEARRLVRTESTYIANMSEMESYKESGIKKYRFLATLDMRTSDICRAMDGKVFLVKDGVPGTNIPPLHPWCRSTTVPEIEGAVQENMKRRARDPVTGKTYLVPADMTYEEWYETYVKTDAKAVSEVKKYKNKYADKKQYEQYKNILGNVVPKSFAKFQEMKYNNSEAWDFIKLDYKRQMKLINNPELELPNAKTATADDRKFTKYLFGGDNQKGLEKGTALTSRLGYNNINYADFKNEILTRASKYPATYKDENAFGKRYEQKMVIYGNKGNPANVIIGWLEKDGKTWMTSAYIKEVKK